MTDRITENRQNSINPRSRANLIPGANAGGRPKTKLLRKYLIRSLLALDDEGVKQIQAVTDALVSKAATGKGGDVHAFEAIRDTIDGKPESGDASAQTGISVNFTIIGASAERIAALNDTTDEQK